MNSRADIALDQAEVVECLERAKTMVLTTNGVDGYPDPVAMWFVMRDGAEGPEIWMRTYAKSQKARNLERDPRAAVLVEEGLHYAELRGVQVSGEVELVRDLDDICTVFVGLLVKYEGLEPAHAPAASDAYRAGPAAKQVAMRIPLSRARVVSWDHSKIGAPS